MLDFVSIRLDTSRRVPVLYPEFLTDIVSKDLMVRGQRLYGIWDDKNQKWYTKKSDAARIIDRCMRDYLKEHPEYQQGYQIAYMRNASSGVVDRFNRFCRDQLDDNYTPLDSKLIFKSDPVSRENYSTHRLSYDVVDEPTPGYDKLMETLYAPEERMKLEWLIGAILAGDNGKVQKFIVLYGDPKTGKSTVINIIQMLFDGYCATFDAAALGNKSDAFALEPFKMNPIVAVQHDGNLSKINDNTRLNSIVSHEILNVNEKHKSIYEMRFNTILFIGSNDPVKISNAKSGLLRRLIDVTPTGERLSADDYEEAYSKIPFELGGIANRCLNLYKKHKKLYDGYRPMSMMASTNDFYDFILSYYDAFSTEEYVTLATAWERYKTYADDANLTFKMTRREFGSELNSYFEDPQHDEWYIDVNGERRHMNSVYRGFKKEQFRLKSSRTNQTLPKVEEAKVTDIYDGIPDWLHLMPTESKDDILRREYGNVIAQYATRTESEAPKKKWENVTTTLNDILSSEVHYLLIGEAEPNLIVVDFDLKKNGKKDLRSNLEAAMAFPPTYAEVSKGGQGLHLHYIYDGDTSKLSILYKEGIEVKVFKGRSALRRRLTLANSVAIAHINSGLPIKKEEATVIDWSNVKNEKAIQTIIEKNLRKEYWPDTSSSINFIKKTLDDAYASGLRYDMRFLRPSVMNFASNSTNQSQRCQEAVMDMHFCSKDVEEDENGKDVVEMAEVPADDILSSDRPIVFFDVEVFKNLFIVCWKKRGSVGKETVARMINPTPSEITELVKNSRLIGFNNRDYDNHICYGRILGYSEAGLYDLSQRIIGNSPNAKFREAFDLAYTDIYDFSNTKQSLKKWEIELGIHHHELGMRWDEEVPEERWEEVADYCADDVMATEAVFEHLKADWDARQMLATITKLPVSTTTNNLSAALIFGNNRKPQNEFVYTDLSKEFPGYEFCPTGIDKSRYKKDRNGKPMCVSGKSIYMGEDPSEGGNVFANPGIHYNVALLDIASLHPTTIEVLNLFGDRYTKRFSELKQCRIEVKHKNWAAARELLDGAISPFIEGAESMTTDEQQELADGLAYALKIVINSIYGLTSAKFPNRFKDPRNVDNIVAKRGALFMITLRNKVQEMGYTVAHVKTDSIKIPNADQKIIDFVMEFGKKYGYTFEHEATYERMCLVNDAVYIAKYDQYGERTKNGKHAGCWTATGTQFKVPYVFKTLFSGEGITFDDMCETKSVSGGGAIYLDFDEDICAERMELEREMEVFKKGHSATVIDPVGRKKKVFDVGTLSESDREEYNDILSRIAGLHRYQFVGRVGQFCPVVKGAGGGTMLREADGKYTSVAGAKGYRWMESELVRESEEGVEIDMDYYRDLANKAFEAIGEYGDPEAFRFG